MSTTTKNLGASRGVTRVHINRHRIDANRKHGRTDPVITVKRGKENYYAHAVEFLGPVTLVTAGQPGPDGKVRKPLSCGARVYIETRGLIKLVRYGKAPEQCSL